MGQSLNEEITFKVQEERERYLGVGEEREKEKHGYTLFVHSIPDSQR